ncbi:hypothetical protein AVEN_173606-1 [Araneus ventricosus]|uniref:Uncharacterized protein n=1 Tax=Araneus ventricosus TaxID=182803 RepID=A0A4Y2CR43_ARAVE|nr:hypothetical protein AVEN_173606-1 [Araneus ventricosus]
MGQYFVLGPGSAVGGPITGSNIETTPVRKSPFRNIKALNSTIPNPPHSTETGLPSPTENHETAQDFQRDSSSPALYSERFMVKEESAASDDLGRPREEV